VVGGDYGEDVRPTSGNAQDQRGVKYTGFGWSRVTSEVLLG